MNDVGGRDNILSEMVHSSLIAALDFFRAKGYQFLADYLHACGVTLCGSRGLTTTAFLMVTHIRVKGR